MLLYDDGESVSVEETEVLIVGAGYSGLGMGAQLARRGRRRFVILEKAGGIGGTWRDNTYPGAACDTESPLYCYDFAPHLTLSSMFAGQEELLGYARQLVVDFDLAEHLRFEVEATSARWEEETETWLVASADGRAFRARWLVTAWGQLNRPSIPDIPGLDDYRGVAFHSARWRHDIDLGGLRVASIGNAASAVQYIPEIAPVVGSLDVYQRSPNWIIPRGQFSFPEEERAQHVADPESFFRLKHALHREREAQHGRTIPGTEPAAAFMEIARQHLERQVPDATLRARLTPDYPMACKRILRTDDYYPALMRANVELVTDPIARFDAEGIVTGDGCRRSYDVVIFGTGFDARSFLGGTTVSGRGGIDLREVWGDTPRAYSGLSIPSFPNMFLLYGPNTNLGHNSVIGMIQVQQEHIIDAIDFADEAGAAAIEVRDDVAEQFDEEVVRRLSASAWAANCNSWYKNAAGRVVNNWYGTVEEYRQTAAFDPENYVAVVTPLRADA